LTGFYQPPQFGSNKPKFTGDEQGGAPAFTDGYEQEGNTDLYELEGSSDLYEQE